MTDRASLARQFIETAGWSTADISLLAGDASNRKYHRLLRPDTSQSAVLMDAPPDTGEDIRPFVAIARYLAEVGLSAPRILHQDAPNGFLLLEDLGDALFARVLKRDPSLEGVLYTAATDTLVDLHNHAPPAGLQPYSPAMMADMAALAFDWYADGAGQANADARQKLHETLRAVLSESANDASVLIQRDYHAENLLWLPERTSVARVGLLDFQDAMLGHRAYDLVSLLQDARRDVSPDVQEDMIAHYIRRTQSDANTFRTAYFCLGAQRNLRIIGVFARLCIRDGKPGYIDLIPRVWDHLQTDLAHPALARVADCLRDTLPEPTPEILQMLKDKCAIVPAQ